MDKARVLIVEDEFIVSMDLRRALEGMGFIVPAEVSSGEGAVDAASRLFPDVVLMDIRLPGQMDGFEATDEIQRRFKIPVVYLTSYSDEETLERARATNPYGFLIKPYEDVVLRATLNTAIHLSEDMN